MGKEGYETFGEYQPLDEYLVCLGFCTNNGYCLCPVRFRALPQRFVHLVTGTAAFAGATPYKLVSQPLWLKIRGCGWLPQVPRMVVESSGAVK